MILDVALPIPVAKAFSYYASDLWRPHLAPYTRVVVPFRSRLLPGFVLSVREGEQGSLKEIGEPVDLFPLLDGPAGRLAEWGSRYYVTPPGLVLKFMVPPPRDMMRYLVVDRGEGKKGARLARAFLNLGKKEVLDGYREGRLLIKDAFTNSPFLPFEERKRPEESAPQTLFIGAAEARISRYVSLIGECLARNESVLMLLPDYHTTGDRFSRPFLEAFPGRVLWYGSGVTPRTRMETYFRARSTRGCLILGNRSSIFLPVAGLGLIIVERHEEESYRNEEDFRFNAGRMALMRAGFEGVPLFLGTASPSIEMMKEAEERSMAVIREDRLSLPISEVVMEKGMAALGGPPPELVERMTPVVERAGKIGIYTPRRDYSSALRCVDCRSLFTCPACGGMLAYRKSTDQLVCPSCGNKLPYEESCPQCGSSLILFSHVGAEYMEEQAQILFPQARVVRVTGETFEKERKALAEDMGGTPLILVGSKSLSTLYGTRLDTLILAGWEELARMSGYRAMEKMAHILAHLLDALDPAEVVFCMERKRRIDPLPFLDNEQFLEEEATRRKIAEFPPYARIFLVEVVKKSEEPGLKTVNRIRQILDSAGFGENVTGPLFHKKEKYRWKLIVKGDGEELYRCLLSLYEMADVRIEADPLYL